ncbi:ATP-binding protein [Candidatus Bathyarchaeota archaeon]|nr:ATP-binding protein [Candidatus Bathyarchaeota archaeon]
MEFEELDLEHIGFIGDGAGITWAPLILIEGKEREVGTEELVIIENLNGNRVLAVCRRGFGRSPGLRRDRYTPGRAYVRIGRRPSSSRDSFDFELSVIGEVAPDGLRQNKLIIAPRSEVYRFRGGNPFTLMKVDMRYEVGYYKDHKEWRVPALPEYIPYHIGVFCTTGWGKTSLVRHKIIPLLREAGYGVLVFDWKGDDYAPYFPGKVIRADEIILEVEERGLDDMAEHLIERAYYCGSSGYQGAIRYILALTDVLHNLNLDEIESGAELKAILLEETPKYIVNYASTRYVDENIRLFKSYFSRLSDSIFDECLRRMREGRYSAEDVIEMARGDLRVIDLSGRESDEKLRIFLEIARVLRYRMDVEKQRIGLALVIDEAPQYCPYGSLGLQRETTRMIVDLCALGRSYQLPIILLSQGIMGEIGINAAVRRNINTWFVGKVHPLDRGEAEKLLPDVDLEFLQSLEVGHFYFFGNMSPSPVPLLIRFEVEEG